ncbi:MAG TPA: GAF domain-containing sensor histidine kinase [Solirubrobacteraceae bacterium]|jgi:signal transduction histidine kinase
MDSGRLRRLLDVGRSLIAELDPDAVLRRMLDVARELTGARYAAIGVLDERREELEQFITVGVDEQIHRDVGDLPRGRGVLGVLIDDPRPLRLAEVGAHPRSYGFPLAHPPMSTFLGVPLVIDGEPWGNLYLTEKADGEQFTADDEEAVLVLADWAAIAISNSRLYRDVRRRRDELERTMHSLETMIEVSRSLGGETDLDRVLELVAKRSRALLHARASEITLLDGDEFVIAAAAGEGVERLRGQRVPIDESIARVALRSGRAQRFDDLPPDVFARRQLAARSAMVTPMVFKNRPVGFLMVFDRLGSVARFNEDDERLLEAFAASAATAVATAQTASSEVLRRSIEASEQERRRWARELHDETLQQLAGLRVLLAAARRSGDAPRMEAAIGEALGLIGDGIAELRGLITDLRPAALDELGTTAAIEALVARVSQQSGLQIACRLELAHEDAPERRHTAEVEATVYRLVQEALANAVKHAHATRVAVSVDERDGRVEIEVRDDGRGFDAARAGGAGFGLLGMRERVGLVNGTLDVTSQTGAGTTVRARIPVEPRAAALPLARPA